VSSRTILVAEDFPAFRQFVCDRLQERADVRVVPVADGAAAVRAAVDLQPDLALLDIGLPTLNGMAAARDIRALSPRSKVVFLTQESTADIVDAARDLGAHAYIHKTRAHYLMPIVGAMLSAQARNESPCPQNLQRHDVIFYANDFSLVETIELQVVAALAANDAVILNLTQSHLAAVRARLRHRPHLVDRATEQGTFVALDADESIAAIVSGAPDPDAMLDGWLTLIRATAAATGRPHPRVLTIGEVAARLVANGHAEMAIGLEAMGKQLFGAPGLPAVDGICVYPELPANDSFTRICSAHGMVSVR